MTGRRQIKEWLEEAKAEGAAFMIVAWDSFDGPDGDYPIFVKPGVDPETCRPSNGDRVMECYDLSLPLEAQLAERTANHWGHRMNGAP